MGALVESPPSRTERGQDGATWSKPQFRQFLRPRLPSLDSANARQWINPIDGSHAYTCDAETYPNIPASYFPQGATKEAQRDREPEEQRCVSVCCFLGEVDAIPNDHDGHQKNDHLRTIC